MRRCGLLWRGREVVAGVDRDPSCRTSIIGYFYRAKVMTELNELEAVVRLE